MTEEQMTKDKFHHVIAVELFNYVWSLLNNPSRTPEEDDKMVHAAHASRYHWGEIGKPIHFLVGEWQISRVYSVLQRPQPALYHAKRCLTLCEQNGIGDFNLAYAYEAIARAYGVSGDFAAAKEYADKALAASENIAQKEDKELVLSDLATIPIKPK